MALWLVKRLDWRRFSSSGTIGWILCLDCSQTNYQNDRIWAKNVEDLEDDERYREMVKNQACIGIFIIFTAKKLHWVIKDKGESWTGQYFRDVILMQHTFAFLNDEENVIDLDNVIFAHDKAPCMRANMTQHLIRDSNIKFSGNDIWPGNSGDLNVTKHVGSIIKNEVEKKCYWKLNIIDIVKTHSKSILQMFWLIWKTILNCSKFFCVRIHLDLVQ